MTLRLTGLLLAPLALAACERSQPAPAPTPAAAPAKPAPPPTNYVMVCKSSSTGLPAACGTPGAVMVGMKPAKATN